MTLRQGLGMKQVLVKKSYLTRSIIPQKNQKNEETPNREIVHLEDQNGTEKYDQIMIGWDPVLPTAGQKRDRSPDDHLVNSKRGGPVKKVDYYNLLHGTVVKHSSDPKAWSEAIEGAKAAQ